MRRRLSKRTEVVQVVMDGGLHSHRIELPVLLCNRCGAKVPYTTAATLGWVAVASDGRGGRNLDFCGPHHVVDYFVELIPPAPLRERNGHAGLHDTVALPGDSDLSEC